MIFTIQDIINTLNHVEVHGRDNLDRLLSAILALEAIATAEQNEETQEQPTEAEQTPLFDEKTKIYAEE